MSNHILPQRLIGHEMEYGCTIATSLSYPTFHEAPSRDPIDQILKKYPPKHLKRAYGDKGYFYDNGMHFHEDCGHPEGSTAESIVSHRADRADVGTTTTVPSAITHLVAQQIAVERVVDSFFSRAQAAQFIAGYHLLGNVAAVELPDGYNRLTKPEKVSWGYHRNIMTRRDVLNPTLAYKGAEHEEQYTLLALHRILRNLLIGAGNIAYSDNRGAFMPATAQKAQHMTTIVSSNSTANRGFIHTRDEPHADAQFYTRQHDISLDYNIHPLYMGLGIGMDLAVVSAIEGGLRQLPGTTITRKDLMNINQAVLYETTTRKNVRLQNGRRVRPVELLLELQAAVSSVLGQLAVPLHSDITSTLDIWRTKALALEHGAPPDPDDYSTPLWQQKMIRLKAYATRHGLTQDNGTPDWNHPRLQSVDTGIHLLPRTDPNAKRTVCGTLRTTKWSQWMPPAELIAFYETNPPWGRAAQRSTYIQETRGKKDSHADWASVGPWWAKIMLDPFAGTTPELVSYLAKR